MDEVTTEKIQRHLKGEAAGFVRYARTRLKELEALRESLREIESQIAEAARDLLGDANEAEDYPIHSSDLQCPVCWCFGENDHRVEVTKRDDRSINLRCPGCSSVFEVDL